METKKSAAKDLTNGSPVKLILGFALPLLLGMLFQQFYSMVDTIIVGKFLGAKALAAVGSTGSINFMIVGFCMGICNGFAIPVAQMFGAGDRKASVPVCGKRSCPGRSFFGCDDGSCLHLVP